MKIFGVDFTSAPGRKKPISCAVCEQDGLVLYMQDCIPLYNFEAFETFLNTPGPWLAALDLPFGQPQKLLTHLSWPQPWEEYIQTVSSMGKQAFEETLTRYKERRPAGDKHHLRVTDRLAGACSPMMLQRVPVARMFFQGTPRLLASGVSVLPCRPTEDTRIVIEGYPALVARKLIGKVSYKSDELRKQTPEKKLTRQSIIRGLRSPTFKEIYGFKLELSDALANALVEDPTADQMDALLCAIQAAWAYHQREHMYGIPSDCNKHEGWIVDPALQ